MLRWITQLLTGSFSRRTQASRSAAEERHAALVRAARDCNRAGDLSRAEQLCAKVLEEEPDHAEALYLLGEMEAVRGNGELAIGLIRRAISVDDSQPQFHYALGCVLGAAGDRHGAEESYRRTLALDPSNQGAHVNLGCMLQAQGELALETGTAPRELATQVLDEAISHFRAAADIAPERPDAWINLGYAMARSRALDEALTYYGRALGLDPNLADARFARSIVLLTQGKFLEGWEDYEWRWQASKYPKPVFAPPEWDGSPLAGKTVLLYTEQGLGDAIQFVRYAPLLAARGARVIVRCPAALKRLCETVPGVAEVRTPEHTAEDFDVHCALLSLPRILRTTAEGIPGSTPYLSADPARVRKWAAHLGRSGITRVGLAWAGSAAYPYDSSRTLPLAAMAPLAEIPGAALYSLQKGGAEEQIAQVPFGDRIVNLAPDFDDTAAAIANLDLVISVDTSIAHLAGALGRPVWLLLSYVPNWRWGLEGERTPWYPSMRLYRQSRRGDWSAVLFRVAQDLQKLCAQPVTSPR